MMIVTKEVIDLLSKYFMPKGGKVSQTIQSVLSWFNIAGKPTEFPPEAHTHPTSDIIDLNEGLVGTKEVDETDIADNKILVYDTTSGKLLYESKPSGSGVLNKYDATTAPTATDDDSAGYEVGSDWVDILNAKIYKCLDATTDNAVWQELTSDVKLSGDQTIAGVKTFSSFPVTPSSAPITDYQVANKKYVDDNTGGGSAAWTTFVKTSDSVMNNDITMTDDEHLTTSINAGSYVVRGCLFGYEMANSDFKFRLNFTGSLTSSQLGRLTAAAGLTSFSTNIGSANSNLTVSTSSSGRFMVMFEAHIIVSTSGTLSIQWAQNSGVAEDTTLYKGSYFEYL